MQFTPPTTIGHRGAAGLAPENTLAAIRAAAAAGLAWVEFDVKLTRDGVPVLMHDEEVSRTTDGDGAIAEIDYAATLRLDAGSWFAPRFLGQRIPSLAETIQELASLRLGANLELKPCPGRARETARALVACLEAHWPASLPQPLVSSFDRTALAEARAAAPGLQLGYLARRLEPDWQDQTRALGCVSIHLAKDGLTPEECAAVRAAGLPLLVYTVNDAEEALRLRAAGAVSLFTDRPDRVPVA